MTSGLFTRLRALKDAPIRLAEADPDLFAELDPAGRREAAAIAVAPRLSLPRGRWAAPQDGRGCLGLLVVDGKLIRSVSVGGNPRSEIVGPGDLLRPWEAGDGLPTLPVSVRWDVLAPARLAVIDGRLLEQLCRWPAVVSALTGRAINRSRWLALQLAITDVRRIDDRLLVLFWHLADRWGRVGPEGVALDVRLTHEVLAQLVGAQRPTVTTALRRLEEAGALRRRPDRTWLLPLEPPDFVVDGRLQAVA